MTTTLLGRIDASGRLALPKKPDRVWWGHPRQDWRDSVLLGERALHGPSLMDTGHDYRWERGDGDAGTLIVGEARRDLGAWVFLQWGAP